MRPMVFKGFVYNILKDIGDSQFPVGGSLAVLGTNKNTVLALTTDENIILFSAELLNDVEAFELVGVFSSGEVEDVFKPLIKRMKKGEYGSFMKE